MDSASDYIDGEIPTTISERIKQHLGICSDCDSWVKTLAATVGLIKEVPQEEVPDSLMSKIRDIPRSNS
jgi:predicted anti-sigma-YlaC factor YlaD